MPTLMSTFYKTIVWILKTFVLFYQNIKKTAVLKKPLILFLLDIFIRCKL